MIALSHPSKFRNDRARVARRLGVAAAALTVLFGMTGCMHRRMTLRTNPPGALVVMDGKEVGYTPFTADFTYYGTRELQFMSPGFETLTVMQPFKTPWYQVPPFDFVSDNFLPFKLTNRHEFQYQLQPTAQVPANELLDRANSYRTQADVGPR